MIVFNRAEFEQWADEIHDADAESMPDPITDEVFKIINEALDIASELEITHPDPYDCAYRIRELRNRLAEVGS